MTRSDYSNIQGSLTTVIIAHMRFVEAKRGLKEAEQRDDPPAKRDAIAHVKKAWEHFDEVRREHALNYLETFMK